jgi:flagellar motor switch protein FliG
MTAKVLTGLEKAALLLKSLSPAVVDKVLATMDPKHSKQLTAELAKVSARPDLKEATARVLDEAVGVLGQDRPQPAATAPATAAAAQVDARIASDAAKDAAAAPNEADPLGAIAAVSPELLSAALEDENARTIALLMNRMEVEAAGHVFKRLSPAKRKEVSVRFTDGATVADDLLRHIAGAVLKKCEALRSTGPAAAEQGEREKRMAGLLRGLERIERMETLAALEESDAALAGRIKAMLYLFEDILRMENSSIQKLLSEIDMKTLASALYGAGAETQERFQTNLSRRAQESLKEEIELTGKVPSAKVKEARQMLEEAMQRLDQRGEFVLKE